MRFPLFSLEGYDFDIYEEPKWLKGDIEPYWPDPTIWLDSEGRVLVKTPTPDRWAELTDSGIPPDPERLRFMLLWWLGCRYVGQRWPADTSLDCLIKGARARMTWHAKQPRGPNIGEIFSRFLRVMHLRRTP